MRAVLVLGLVVATGARAAADCADAQAALGAGDLTRAALAAASCDDGDPVRARIAKAVAAKGYAQVTVVTKPAGAAVTFDARPELALHGGDELWLPAGTYTFTAQGMQSTATVKRGGHAVVLLELPAPPAAPQNGTVDFGDEGGGEVVNGPPPKIVHPSLIPDRYQKILNAQPARVNELDDQPVLPWRWPRHRFAIEAGAGASGGRLAASVAVAARVDWLDVEAEWMRRGVGDELALPVQYRHWMYATHEVHVSGAAGAQGEVRLDRGVDRIGASAVGSIDGELRSGPIADLRVELGSTWAIGLRIGVAF